MTQWKEAALEDLVIPDAPIGYGIVQPGPYASGGVPTIAIRDLLNVREDHLHRTAPSIEANYRRSRVEAGDILVSVKGTTGRVGIVPPNLKGNISRDVARLRFRDDQVPEFWLQMLRSGDAQRVLEQATVGTTRQELSIWTLRKLRFLYPSRQEQAEIAKSLSEADDLIDAIAALVTKKRDVKQGMMQELLSGHTRLPGFDGAWAVKQIGEIAQVKAGGTPSTAISRYWGGEIPWMSSGEIHQKRIWEVVGRITTDGLRESSAQMLPVGTVLMALAGQGKTRGTVAVSRLELATNQSIAGIFPSEQHDPDFLYYNLDRRYDELRGESAGDGGRGGLNLTIIKKLDVLMPPVDEQRAIANVLTDADDELEAFERRLESARAIKTGMMQELLAGRARLPLEAAV
jgi:type I restriction enzyme S subunit